MTTFEERERYANPVERIRGIAAVIDGMTPEGLDRSRQELQHHIDIIEAEIERICALKWDLYEAIRDHKSRACTEPIHTFDLMERTRRWDIALWLELDRIENADDAAGRESTGSRDERCGYVPEMKPDPPPGPPQLPRIPCVREPGHEGPHNHWPFVA